MRKQLAAADFAARVRPGARIALGVGSRGIANLATIVRATVDYWKAAGCAPFIFPSMGSHGAATAPGQADVLAHYGVTESAMGCPLLSSLDVVPLGNTAEGVGAFMDRNAYSPISASGGPMGRDIQAIKISGEDRRKYREKVQRSLDVFAQLTASAGSRPARRGWGWKSS